MNSRPTWATHSTSQGSLGWRVKEQTTNMGPVKRFSGKALANTILNSVSGMQSQESGSDLHLCCGPCTHTHIVKPGDKHPNSVLTFSLCLYIEDPRTQGTQEANHGTEASTFPDLHVQHTF